MAEEPPPRPSALGSTALSTKVLRSGESIRDCSAIVSQLLAVDVPLHKAFVVQDMLHWCAKLLETAAAIVERQGAGPDTDEAMYRMRLLHESAFNLSFFLEEWSTVDAWLRLRKIFWMEAQVDTTLTWLFHRAIRLSNAVRLPPYAPQRTIDFEKTITFDPNYPLRDQWMQCLWRGYFGDKFTVVYTQDFFYSLQNEFRSMAKELLSHADIKFLQRLLGSRSEDVILASQVQRLLDLYLPRRRKIEDDEDQFWTDEQRAAFEQQTLEEDRMREGPGAWQMTIAAAKENFLEPGSEGAVAPWYFPRLNSTSAYMILSKSVPGSFLVRPSKELGCFVLQWVAISRTVKSAKLYAVNGGFTLDRRRKKVVFPTVPAVLHALRRKFSIHAISLPQEPREGALAPLPTDD